jgi:hypothetical protein
MLFSEIIGIYREDRKKQIYWVSKIKFLILNYVIYKVNTTL